MKNILAIYDIMGIQDYVFSSNKLKENLGASIIVQNILDEDFKKCITDICNKNEDQTEFKIMHDESILAEIIYIGGGNAMVAYKDEEIMKNINKALSVVFLKKTNNTLNYASGYITTDFANFFDDRKKLIPKLRKNKFEFQNSMPLLGISITREGFTDGLPAQINEKVENKNEYISMPSYQKRKEEENRKDYFETEKKLLEENSNYAFPRELDELGQKSGEDYIAIVHIDGNNMGNTIDKIIGDEKDYHKAVKKMRHLSKEISQIYNNTMIFIIQKIIIGLKNDKFKDNFNLTSKDKVYLPIRPIVLNGDDVTFICHGKLGITLAVEFLKKINMEVIKIDNFISEPLSACAGVAIVNSHFPFYRAYELAEELCTSAKSKGKIISLNEKKPLGSWLDFHLLQTGITTELNNLRETHYQVSGMNRPDRLEKKQHGNIEMEMSQFNLLWRPWCVSGEISDKYKWHNFEQIFEDFTSLDDKTGWPRNRLKGLQNIFIKSKEDAELYLKETESRKHKLPLFENNRELYNDDNITPYFDVLDLMDLYLKIPDDNERGDK